MRQHIIQNRILRHWAGLHKDDITQGRVWYETAYQACEGLAKEARVSVKVAVAAVAVTSPRCAWNRNIKAARRLLHSLKSGERYAGLSMSVKLFQSGDLGQLVFSGPKVTAFAQAIHSRGHADVVVVDSWMGRAVGCERVTTRNYPVLEASYKSVADKVGVLPCHLQASVWVKVRRTRGQ